MTKTSMLGLPPEEDASPAPLPVTGPSPSASWASVTAEDIGTQFESVPYEDVFGPKANKVVRIRPFKNKFIRGRSRFITYRLKISVTKPKPIGPPNALNANTKVSKQLRSKFGKALAVEIGTLRDLMLTDILPVSLSLQSASEEVKDLTSQLVDDPIAVPLDYLRSKSLQAIQLRLTRHLSERFKLTPDEAVHMLPEFIRVLGKPNEHQK